MYTRYGKKSYRHKDSGWAKHGWIALPDFLKMQEDDNVIFKPYPCYSWSEGEINYKIVDLGEKYDDAGLEKRYYRLDEDADEEILKRCRASESEASRDAKRLTQIANSTSAMSGDTDNLHLNFIQSYMEGSPIGFDENGGGGGISLGSRGIGGGGILGGAGGGFNFYDDEGKWPGFAARNIRGSDRRGGRMSPSALSYRNPQNVASALDFENNADVGYLRKLNKAFKTPESRIYPEFHKNRRGLVPRNTIQDYDPDITGDFDSDDAFKHNFNPTKEGFKKRRLGAVPKTTAEETIGHLIDTAYADADYMGNFGRSSFGRNTAFAGKPMGVSVYRMKLHQNDNAFGRRKRRARVNYGFA